MGKNQRVRKEQRLEEKLQMREVVKERGREKFWGQVMPILKFGIALLITVVLLWGGKMEINHLNSTPAKPESVGQSATIVTAKGSITMAFYQNDAPRTVQNFALLAQRGYYNGTTFHRVEPGFVIQGGDPLSRNPNATNVGTGGESAWGGKFNDELNTSTASYKQGYVRGTVAMANSGPNTNGSQFFIVLGDQPSLPKSYTIFGHVTAGLDVVDKIAKGDVMEKVTVVMAPN